MNNTFLIEKCKRLPYCLTGKADCLTIETTQVEIRKLEEQFGTSMVLGTLAKLWSIEQTACYFERLSDKPRGGHGIKTIATSFYRAYDGGTERVNAELMNLWTQMGLNVILLTEEPENPLDFEYPDSVKRYQIPSYKDLSSRLEAINRICKEERVDLFINHNWNNPMFIWECAMLKGVQIPYVLYCHAHFSWTLGQGRDGLFQTKAMKYCDLVVAISESNARFYQMSGCNAYLVDNPVPSDLRNVMPSTLDSRHVLLVGRLSWEKYPLEALEIIKTVHEKRPDVVFDIVGSGHLELDAKQYVHKNNLDNVVVFHGNKTMGEIAEFYRNCACVLFTSKMEGYPMVVLETKAHGIPLVMYDLPYLSLVKDGKGYISAESGDILTMANHLIRIMDDFAYRKTLGKQARESFETLLNYDLEQNWRSILDIVSGEDVESDYYYGQKSVSESDKYIIPIMLEQMKKSYDSLLDSSVNYRVGKIVLYIPNQLKKLIKKIGNKAR